jgi:phosphotriesterase-related protein
VDTIVTVTGDVAGADLGFVLVHEHVIAASPGILPSWPELHGGRGAVAERGIAALRSAQAVGVRTIVDCTTYDLGRDAALLAEVAAASGVYIIGATGCWLDPPATMRARTVDQLARRFTADLTDGMDGTDIRAGVIKVASDERVEPFAASVLQAAAMASLETGAPIITHTAAAHRTGLAQAEILEKCGVNPARVAIGHSDDSPDTEYLAGLAERGYRISMDRLPNGALPQYGGQDVDARLDMIARLVDRGYGDRVLLAHDDPISAPLLTDEDQVAHLHANPRQIAFVAEVVLPGLERRGLGADVIRQLTVDNPRVWLTGMGK